MKTINNIAPLPELAHGVAMIIHTESLLTDDHRRICKQFGCGKELTQLYSEYCADHPSKPIDITLIIKL